MKNFTLSLLAISLAATATAEGSALSVQSASDEIIVVSLDQGNYTAPGRFVEFNDLAPGIHVLRVSRVAVNRPSGYQHAPGQQKRMEIFRGTVYVPVATRLETEVSRRHLDILACEPLVVPAGSNCQVQVAMSDAAFLRLLQSIDSKSFESSRLAIARQAAGSNFFTSCQVSEILGSFSFESTKLEFAKCAFAHTLDQENYFLVNDAFTFESSIAELQQYINTSGQMLSHLNH